MCAFVTLNKRLLITQTHSSTVLCRGFICNYSMQHAAIIAGFPTCWIKN